MPGTITSSAIAKAWKEFSLKADFEEKVPSFVDMDIDGPRQMTRNLNSVTLSFTGFTSSVSNPSDVPLIKGMVINFLKEFGGIKLVRSGPDELQVIVSEDDHSGDDVTEEVPEEATNKNAVIVGRRPHE